MFSKVKDGILDFTKKHYLMSLLATYVDMFLYSILSSIIIFPISFIFAFGMMIPIFMLQAENVISILGIILLVILQKEIPIFINGYMIMDVPTIILAQ